MRDSSFGLSAIVSRQRCRNPYNMPINNGSSISTILIAIAAFNPAIASIMTIKSDHSRCWYEPRSCHEQKRTTSLDEKCSSCLRLATGPESLLRERLRLRDCCRSTHLDCLDINYRDCLLDDSFFHKTLPLSKRI